MTETEWLAEPMRNLDAIPEQAYKGLKIKVLTRNELGALLTRNDALGCKEAVEHDGELRRVFPVTAKAIQVREYIPYRRYNGAWLVRPTNLKMGLGA